MAAGLVSMVAALTVIADRLSSSGLVGKPDLPPIPSDFGDDVPEWLPVTAGDGDFHPRPRE